MDVQEKQAAFDEQHEAPGDRPVMRARFEHNGSPRYLLYAIKRLGLDRDHGFHLDVELVSDETEDGLETVEAKLQGGDADLIDIDYLSTARERAEGAPIVGFHPYGRTVGSLIAAPGSDVEGLADLRDRRVGVVRRLDKNWILTRAACRRDHDFDPEAAATSVEAGSKVELSRMLRAGEVDAGLQFWQIVPELTETGDCREVVPMAELVQRLSGTDGTLPISTFLTSERYLADRPKAVGGFRDAYRDAVSRLREDDDLWTEIGDRLMDTDDPRTIRAIRDGWREMVVADWDRETLAGMNRLFDHLLDVAGADVLGVDRIPNDAFTTEVGR
ncbi:MULTISPECIES: ABC transporter substrate-binding protein [Halorussus]|uniref:ABC transporter substrate-binding protein n=1 Tax=Halorussus TaxID=1070314 RepID=UPI00209D7610|nr:ABC transporter substrate-binding protein [Halorussus vallis]USZ75032.1 ABC transporter substrate-binding protein [Halorussus vallis]